MKNLHWNILQLSPFFLLDARLVAIGSRELPRDRGKPIKSANSELNSFAKQIFAYGSSGTSESIRPSVMITN